LHQDKAIGKAILIDKMLNGAIHAMSNTVSVASLSSERIKALLKKDDIHLDKLTKVNTTINSKFIDMRDYLQAFQLYISNDEEMSDIPLKKIVHAAQYFTAYILKKKNIFVVYEVDPEIELNCNASDIIYFLSYTLLEIFDQSEGHEDRVEINLDSSRPQHFILTIHFNFDHQAVKNSLTTFLENENDFSLVDISNNQITFKA
jgi:hypothetical protein